MARFAREDGPGSSFAGQKIGVNVVYSYKVLHPTFLLSPAFPSGLATPLTMTANDEGVKSREKVCAYRELKLGESNARACCAHIHRDAEKEGVLGKWASGINVFSETCKHEKNQGYLPYY